MKHLFALLLTVILLSSCGKPGSTDAGKGSDCASIGYRR